MGYIYKVTNDVNGKMYIGKTEYDQPEKRWDEHLRDYKRERCERRPFYDAIKKYGSEHFHFEVIEETENPVEREQFWIEKLRTYVGYKDCNGYNATLGGDGKKYLNLNDDIVIEYHINESKYQLNKTAKYFNVDPTTIKHILQKHDVTWLSLKQIKIQKSYEQYGYLYKISKDKTKILGKYKSESEAIEANNNFKETPLNNAIRGVERKNPNNVHLYKGYYWYRDNNIPEKLKILPYEPEIMLETI